MYGSRTIVAIDALSESVSATSDTADENQSYKTPRPRIMLMDILVALFIWVLYNMNPGNIAHTQSVSTAAADTR